MRVFELYCGIGGCAAALSAWPGASNVVAAVDIHRGALDVYSHNFAHPTVAAAIDSLSADRLQAWDADLWWLSPPCQPFTRRGVRRDIDDPRCRSLLTLLTRLESAPPRFLALENVPGFHGSQMHGRLRDALERAGFGTVHERTFCPTEAGVPNRRQRFYLLAAREPIAAPRLPPLARRCLRDFLLPERDADPDLHVDPELLEKYRGAIHVLELEERNDPGAVSHCFTSAYGRSPVRSGSYLRTARGVRRFAPVEILRLLGFPEGYSLPREMGLNSAWRLVGNSLSIVAVRAVLGPVLEEASPIAGNLR